MNDMAKRGFKRKYPVKSGTVLNDSANLKTVSNESENSSNSEDSDCETGEHNVSADVTKNYAAEEKQSGEENSNDNIDGEEGPKVADRQTVLDILGIEKKKQKKQKAKKQYYVVFVGNLSYKTNEADIAHHFISAGEVKDVRLLTNQDTGKSKGCAYVEFYKEQVHKSALMLHHSQLDGRTINVEFTSAGRKTEIRDGKLKDKNEKGARFKMGSHVAVRKNRPMQKGKLKVKGSDE